MTFRSAALALGLGAIFPNFETDNTAEIPTSFGGLVFMMSAVSYRAVAVILLAWPVNGSPQARLDSVSGGGEFTPLALGGVGGAYSLVQNGLVHHYLRLSSVTAAGHYLST